MEDALLTSLHHSGVDFHHSSMKPSLLRRMRLFALFLFAVPLVLLAVSAWLTWHGNERLMAIRSAVARIHDIQLVGLKLQQMLEREATQGAAIDPKALAEARAEMLRVAVASSGLDAEASERLQETLRLLSPEGEVSRAKLLSAISELRMAMYQETGAELQVLDTQYAHGQTELQLAWIALIALPAILVFGLFQLRDRLLRPISNLNSLLLPIAAGQFHPVDLDGVDPVLTPLFVNFNHMVTRLAELEMQHREHMANLENEVRAATETLLRQQDDLARAQRLAAVGELSAAVAHEIRNPLAGMQMTLANIRRETTDSDVIERLDLVIAEVQRVARLLTDLLVPARGCAENPSEFRLAPLVSDLLRIARYRIPHDVELTTSVPSSLACRLPQDALRQALLNLVLNAVEALGLSRGRIEVAASVRDGALLLTVCDDGPGYPRELIESGVRPNWTGRAGGTGLGLAIVQRFARDQRGDLRLSNRSPHGACAEMTLTGAWIDE
jgi:C4-dicarboxylate-specific signal transduction histidine kinase